MGEGAVAFLGWVTPLPGLARSVIRTVSFFSGTDEVFEEGFAPPGAGRFGGEGGAGGLGGFGLSSLMVYGKYRLSLETGLLRAPKF